MLDQQVRGLSTQAQVFTNFMDSAQNSRGIAQPMTSANVDVIAREVQERFDRSRNLVVFNLPDNDDALEDRHEIFNILSRIGAPTDYNITIRRVGRKITGKNRVTIVCLKSRNDVLLVLRNRNQLSRNLKVSDDKTRDQRKHYEDLKKQVVQHNNSNLQDLWRIKYHNGVPKIVPVNEGRAAGSTTNPGSKN